MNEEHDKKDLKNVSDEELESEYEHRVEEKWEKRGDELEKKIDKAVNRLPRPVNALLDAVCITAVIAGVMWVVMKIGWRGSFPPWSTFAMLAGAVFVLSLIYRYFIKGGSCCRK
jgi:hypothetical protein